MRKLVVLTSLFICFTASLFAQDSRMISGRVVDQKTNSGLGGVTINAGSSKALSDANGNYKITTKAKSIVFSYVGYENFTAIVGKGNTINVTLILDTKLLEEVVITGYSRERKTQFAGAATTISGKTVNDVPMGSFDQALQGRVPGMLVNSGSGRPGASATITIRGIQSISGAGTQPLFVLDGVPMPSFDMQTINPDDFESITVLKDASAAALYGARGGTGVIVITSKRGKNAKTQVTYKSQYGYTQAPDFSRLNMMNTKEMLAYEEREKLAGTPGWTYSPKNPALPTGMDATRKQFMLDSIGGIDIDYANIFYRQGVSKSHELSVLGGNDKTKFYLSTAYFDQEGIDLGSSLKRYTIRFNLDHTVNKLSFQLSSTVGYSNIVFTWDQRSSNTAVNTVRLQYTLDGTTWTNFTMTVNNTTFCLGELNDGRFQNSTAGDSYRRISVNLSSISGANNNANFGVRILAAHYQTSGAFRTTAVPTTVATGGTMRFDNVSFKTQAANVIPSVSIAAASNVAKYAESIGLVNVPITVANANSTEINLTFGLSVYSDATENADYSWTNTLTIPANTIEIPAANVAPTGQQVVVKQPSGLRYFVSVVLSTRILAWPINILKRSYIQGAVI